MKHKRAMTRAAAAAFGALLIGWFALSGADQAGPHPHDRANHHPRVGGGPSN